MDYSHKYTISSSLLEKYCHNYQPSTTNYYGLSGYSNGRTLEFSNSQSFYTQSSNQGRDPSTFSINSTRSIRK